MTSLKDKIAAWPENKMEMFSSVYGNKAAAFMASHETMITHSGHHVEVASLTILQREVIEELVNAYKLLLKCYAETLDNNFTDERSNLKHASNRMNCAIVAAQEMLTKTKA